MRLRLPKFKLPARRNVEETIAELELMAGFAMLFYGLYILFIPAAFIVCGILLILSGMPRKGAQ